MLRALPLLACLLSIMPSVATADGQRFVTPEDAKGWEFPSGLSVSRDGRWTAITLRQIEDDNKLVIQSLDTSTKWVIPRGTEPSFSPDAKWIAYRINPPYEKLIELMSPGKKVPTDLGIRPLKEGKAKVLTDIDTFQFLSKGHKLMALGTDKQLVLLDLIEGEEVKYRQVSSAVANSDGSLVAIACGEGAQRQVGVYDTREDDLKTLTEGDHNFTNLAWSKDGKSLAFLVGDSIKGMDGDYKRLVLLRNIGSEVPTMSVFDPAKRSDFPKGFRISETGEVSLSDDGESVSFGICEWRKPPKKGDSTVEIWNSRDEITVPERRVAKDKTAKMSMLALWRTKGDGFLQIESSLAQDAKVLPGFEYAYVTDDRPYRNAAERNYIYWDIEIVRLVDGQRVRAFEKSDNIPFGSRSGRYLTAFDKQHWWVYDIRKNKKSNVTGDQKVSFANEDWNFAKGSEMAMADPEWLADDGLLLYDRYDAWLWRPDSGSMVRLTDGRKDNCSYRRLASVNDSPAGADLTKATLFRTFDEATKRTGFWLMAEIGQGVMVSDAQPVVRRFFAVAPDADRVVYSESSFEKPPAFFVASRNLANPKPFLTTNPQQANFAWGKSEVIDFKSKSGTPLHGTLIYPAGYDPSKTYPMVTVVYERESDDAFQYLIPSYNAFYNPQAFSQNGYFVLQPDIIYERPRHPGQSAVECVEAALDAVAAKKVGVDPTRIGIMGHSWGGYEAAFISTLSKRFAVGACGSGLYDFASLAGSHYWRSGFPASALVETLQGRMGVPIWDDPKAYMDNSVIWQAPKRSVPLLIQVGDKDDIVGFDQSVQLYNAMRRSGKNAVMLCYRDDGHMLQKRANLIDYSRRLRHFFDVYLKGATPEPWVNQPYKE